MQKCGFLSAEDAEDIAIQAFKEIQTQQHGDIPSEGDFRARLMACTKNRVLDWLKKTAASRKHVVNAEAMADPTYKDLYYNADPTVEYAFEVMIRDDDRAIVQEIIAGLEPEIKLPLFDRLVLGMKQREIGEKYGWGLGSVHNRLEGALKRAREVLSSNPKLKDLPGIKYDEI